MIRRRDLFTILGASATAEQLDAFQHGAHQIQTTPKDYKLQFFPEAENRLVADLAEMILPADDHSPGARAARVNLYIDLVLATSPRGTQSEWKAGLAEVMLVPAAERPALLDRLAKAEANPSTPSERFFVNLKRMTLAGYYTSEIGYRQELGRKSPEVLAEFPGACKHPSGTHR